MMVQTTLTSFYLPIKKNIEMGSIYSIQSPSGKYYVGQTTRDPNLRFKEHLRDSSNCTLLKAAISKYGKNNMKLKIIEKVEVESLDDREVYWISKLNSLVPNGYNLTSGGESRKQISETVRNNMKSGKRDAFIKITGREGGFIHEYETKSGKRFKVGVKNMYMGTFKTYEDATDALNRYFENPFEPKKVYGSGCIRKRVSKKSGITKYVMNICFNKKRYIKSFSTEQEAQNELDRFNEDRNNWRFKPTERTVGCIFHRDGRFQASYRRHYIGNFQTKQEARTAIDNHLKSLSAV
jgi:predicted GIY-YIG superfamily endonuclease